MEIAKKSLTFLATLSILSTPLINPHKSDAQIVPSSPKDIYDLLSKPREWFNRSNFGWFVGTKAAECAYINYTSIGESYCERNPKLIYIGYDQASIGTNYPCSSSNNYAYEIGNEYARKNSLKLKFYTPQNRVYTFEKY
jgi:hypothetical protein